MKRLATAFAMGGLSSGCAFAAVGLALYAQGPLAWDAAWLFGGFGLVAGMACAGLHWVFDGMPAQERSTLAPEALAAMVRATLAGAAAERAQRPGSAADRKPATGAAPAAGLPAAQGASSKAETDQPAPVAEPAVSA